MRMFDYSLGIFPRLFIPLLLGLAAAWVLLAGVRAGGVTLVRGEQPGIRADPLVPHPVVVATILLSMSSPLSRATVAINPATGYAYVLAYTRYAYPYPHSDAKLTIISRTEVISSNTCADCRGTLAIDPNRGYVYMPVDGGVAVVSGTEVVQVIPVGNQLMMLIGRAIDIVPDSGYVYVDGYRWDCYGIPEIAWCGGVVWVVNGFVKRLDVGGMVYAIGVNPATGYAYATCRTGGMWDFRYTVVIAGTQEVSSVLSFGEAIGINHANGYVYIAEADQNHVYVLSGTQVEQILPTGIEPKAIGVNPRTGYVYIANASSDSVTVISETQVITALTVGLAPAAIGVNPESGYVYVANAGNGTLSVISGTQVVWTIPVGHAPGALGVNPSAGYVYVVDYDDATVSVIREMILPYEIYLPLIAKTY